MRVSVVTIDDRTEAFDIPPDIITIRDFKRYIESTFNIPVENQRMIFRGRVLENAQTLLDSGLDGFTINLVETSNSRTNPAEASDINSPNDVIIPASGGTNASESSDDPRNFPRHSHSVVQRLRTCERFVRRAESIIRTLNSSTPTEHSQDINRISESNNTSSESGDSYPDTQQSAEMRRYTRNYPLGAGCFGRLDSALARLLPLTSSLNQILQNYRENLLQASLFNSRHPCNLENLFSSVDPIELTAELLHQISHAYHSISDIFLAGGPSNPTEPPRSSNRYTLQVVRANTQDSPDMLEFINPVAARSIFSSLTRPFGNTGQQLIDFTNLRSNQTTSSQTNRQGNSSVIITPPRSNNSVNQRDGAREQIQNSNPTPNNLDTDGVINITLEILDRSSLNSSAPSGTDSNNNTTSNVGENQPSDLTEDGVTRLINSISNDLLQGGAQSLMDQNTTTTDPIDSLGERSSMPRPRFIRSAESSGTPDSSVVCHSRHNACLNRNRRTPAQSITSVISRMPTNPTATTRSTVFDAPFREIRISTVTQSGVGEEFSFVSGQNSGTGSTLTTTANSNQQQSSQFQSSGFGPIQETISAASSVLSRLFGGSGTDASGSVVTTEFTFPSSNSQSSTTTTSTNNSAGIPSSLFQSISNIFSDFGTIQNVGSTSQQSNSTSTTSTAVSAPSASTVSQSAQQVLMDVDDVSDEISTQEWNTIVERDQAIIREQQLNSGTSPRVFSSAYLYGHPSRKRRLTERANSVNFLTNSLFDNFEVINQHNHDDIAVVADQSINGDSSTENLREILTEQSLVESYRHVVKQKLLEHLEKIDDEDLQRFPLSDELKRKKFQN